MADMLQLNADALEAAAIEATGLSDFERAMHNWVTEHNPYARSRWTAHVRCQVFRTERAAIVATGAMSQ